MAADGTTAPARRPITIRDLLSHRSGITYGFLNGGPVGEAYRKEGVLDGLTVMPATRAEVIDKLAAAPLVSQPGAAWNYSLSTDVLGRVVEVVSGKPFDVFLRERVFMPLGMTDTSFEVPDAKWSRLTTAYAPDGAGGIRPMKDPETFGNAVFSPGASYKPGKRYFSGGAGLVSTAGDYAKFCQMLIDGGAAGSTRLLSPRTVELMTANHTADLGNVGGLLGAGTAFGLGFQVTTDAAATQTMGSNGLYGWSGIYGTAFWIDPKEKLVAIMMVQRYPGSPVAAAFRPLVYQALVK
jgi:CubicO group peptidase (beta-lactamase class C family)